MVLDCISTNYLLYVSHSLSRWGDRMWGFAVGLFLIYLHPQSFLVPAIYELTLKLFGTVLTGPIGTKLDSLARLKAMRVSLILQNTAVAGACVIVLAAFKLNITYYCKEALFYVFIILVTLTGIISTLSSNATKIVIERDWIVILTKGNSDQLSEINAGMRRIDQVCLLLAPILAGAFVSAFGVTYAAAIIAIWNVVSLFFEYFLLHCVFKRVPALSQKESTNNSDSRKDKNDLSFKEKISKFFDTSLSSFKIYFQQEVALIGFCLSLVYLTVLGFGVITVGYLRLSGIKDVFIGAAMAIGAVFGILGTICYTPLVKKFGVSAAGCFGAVCLFASISLCLSSVFFETSLAELPEPVPGSCNNASTDSTLPDTGLSFQISTIIILVGIVTLRFGLWILDLAISQHFQEVVKENQRNTVGGVQASLNSFFDCLYILLTIAIPDPSNFNTLICISFAAVAGSCVIYIIWFLRTGGIKGVKEGENYQLGGSPTTTPSPGLSSEEGRSQSRISENPLTVGDEISSK